ncbi:SDR family NAD(P)-dependent oxidoreductase [Wenyingzhuangia sp. IMCC45574]
MKKAIVIGGTSGIGKCLAVKLLQQHWQVAVTGRRKELLLELSKKHETNLITKVQDVRDLTQSKEVLEALFLHMQTVDLVIVASGISELNYELDTSIENNVILTNVNGVSNAYQFIFNKFKEQKNGHLVGITSIAGLRGNRHCPSYSASKAFQLNYLEALRCMAKHQNLNITITDVQPGFVDTPMAKGDGLFWVASVDKASSQILKAIKRRKRKVYVTKRWKLIAYIMKLVPNLLLERI